MERGRIHTEVEDVGCALFIPAQPVNSTTAWESRSLNCVLGIQSDLWLAQIGRRVGRLYPFSAGCVFIACTVYQAGFENFLAT